MYLWKHHYTLVTNLLPEATVDVTMNDVAQAAGVSRSLVSLVFQDSPKVSPASRDRVMDAANALGYRPNALARSLASKSNRTLGVLLNDITNPFFAHVYEALAVEAESAGYNILMGAGQRSVNRERNIIESFLSHRVAALILVSPRMAAKEIENLVGPVPTVVVGKTVNLPSMDVVTNDEFVGARLAVDHLFALGHRKIAHVSGGTGAGAADRKAGYSAAMAGLGLKNNVDVVAGDFTEQAGHNAARTLLKRDELPTAIFCANDLVAVGLLSEFANAGVRVPEDVSIVGYDNSTLAGLSLVKLTTIEQPLTQLGKACIELTLQRLQGGRNTSVVKEYEPRLVKRNSTAAPRKS